MFDVDNFNTVKTGITTSRTNNKIILNGTATNSGAINFYDNNTANYVEYISNPTTTKLKAGTYTISLNNINGTQNDIYCNLLICKKKPTIPNTLIAYFSLKNQVSTSFTLDTESDIYLGIQWSANKIFNNFSFDIQLEKSTTPTSYTPHKEQTFTFPLGNEKLMLGDYLADDGIHHVRGQVVLDGSSDETFGLAGEGDTTNGFSMYSNFLINNIKVSAYKVLLSNYFRFVNRNNVNSNTLNFITGGGSTSVVLNIDRNLLNEVSVAGFKTWLSTHNTTVEYELEEEIIVPYTSAQQEVYNQIKQALSYEEQTNISNNQIALFSVEAYQSTKLVLQDFATAIVALGGV